MRSIIIFAILAISCTLSAVEAEKPEIKLSVSAERAVGKFEDDLAKAKREFDAAVAKAKGKLGKALDSEMKRVMKKGDLEGAQQVAALKEQLESRTGFESVDLLGNVLDDQSTNANTDGSNIAGNWKIAYSNGAFRMLTISETLSVQVTSGTFGIGERYQLAYDKDTNTATGVCNGKIDTLSEITVDTIKGRRADGKTFVMTRIK